VSDPTRAGVSGGRRPFGPSVGVRKHETAGSGGPRKPAGRAERGPSPHLNLLGMLTVGVGRLWLVTTWARVKRGEVRPAYLREPAGRSAVKG
jgi:hypothetical protein